MKRVFSLFLAVALIAVLAVPVSASEDSAWFELMDQVSILDNGENWWTMNGSSGVLTIPLPAEKRLRKIDLLLWNPTGQRPNLASVTAGGRTTTLNIYGIGGNLTRISGYLPDTWYESISVSLSKSTSSSMTYEVLSCKVTATGMQEFEASADVTWVEREYTIPTGVGMVLDHESANDIGHSYNVAYTMRVAVYDWQKYDELTIWGSTNNASVDSMRATLGTHGLPMQVSYMSGESSSSWTNWIESDGIGEALTVNGYSKFLYCITLDLSSVDRAQTEPLYIYFTGVFDGYYSGYFNCQYVNGSVFVADTSNVTWWHRFTSFMSGLFGAEGSSGALDDLESNSSSISQSAGQIHEFEESQQAVLDNNLTQIQTTVDFTNFAAALVFVQKYTNMTVAGISDYVIVFTLPMFLGLFFFLCSRVPGITRWKSPPPRSKPKGGGKP